MQMESIMKPMVMRQRLKVDANRTIQLSLPPEMGDEVEIVIYSSSAAPAVVPAQAATEAGFLQNLLSHKEEDCWNEL
jgi:hypothetical protein